MKGILRGAYCVALSISIFLCGVILALSCRGITLYKKELLQNGMTVAITLFMAACIVMLCVYGKDKLQTTRRKFSVFMFLLIGLAQIAFLLLVSRPMTIADPARVQNEALAMLKYHYGQMDPTNSYMQNYGNNHFITICFYYFYKFLTDVGITKVWVPTVVLNVLAIDLGILLTFLSVKKMRGIGTANFALVLFFLCPTTYLWLTSVYTNTLSFPFIMGILYLGLIDKPAKRWRMAVHDVLLAVVMAVGYRVRPTTIIPIIALGLYLTLRLIAGWQNRRALRASETMETENASEEQQHSRQRVLEGAVRVGLVVCVSMAVLFSSSNLVAKHVDAKKFNQQFPVVHWVMMGMNEKSKGGFNRNDRRYTSSFLTKEQKRKADIARLKQRVKKMGPVGLAKHFGNKMMRVWAMGDDDGITNAQYAYQYPPFFRYFAGKQNAWFMIYMQAFRIAMLFLMLCAMCRQFLQREAAPGAMYTLTFAGAVMFFMLWEAGKRYNICFTGVCLLLMAEGADGFTNTVFNKGDAWLKAHFNGMRLHAARLVVLAVGLFCFAGSFAAANQLSHPRTYVEIPYFNSKRGKDEEPIRWRYHKNLKVLEQTIEQGQLEWRNRWNRIRLYFWNLAPNESGDEYRIQVLALDDKEVLYDKTIAPNQVKREGYTIAIAKNKLKQRDSQIGYLIRLTHVGASDRLIPMVCRFPLLDPYPYGELKVDGQYKDWDLSMKIFLKKNE